MPKTIKLRKQLKMSWCQLKQTKTILDATSLCGRTF